MSTRPAQGPEPSNGPGEPVGAERNVAGVPEIGAQGRRDAIDVARAVALFVVVLGHLTMAVIDRPGAEVRGANLLALVPGAAVVAALAPMPIFFAAAGWANARSPLASSAFRLRALVGLAAVVVSIWSAAVVVTTLVIGDAGVVGDGARIATQPLWFVAAYAPLAAGGRVLGRLAATHAGIVVAAGVGLLGVGDAARFGFGAPEWVGWPGFYLAWGTPWVVGAWWRARHEAGGFDERRAGLVLAAVAGLVCVGLVGLAGYHPALIDAVPGNRSNTTPPTTYTAMAGLAQVGILLVCAGALDRAGRRWRRFWDRAGEAAVGVYAWHLTALVLCAAAVAAGVPVPERLTAAWWWTRPLWWSAVLALTGAMVVATAAGRARLARGGSGGPTSTARAIAGVAMAAAGGAVVGLEGPRSVAMAVLCSTLFVGGWLLLRPQGRASASSVGRSPGAPGQTGSAT